MTLSDLTPRQREILKGIANGRSGDQLAADLGITRRTVYTHTRMIRARLGVKSRVLLIRKALEWGM